MNDQNNLNRQSVKNQSPLPMEPLSSPSGYHPGRRPKRSGSWIKKLCILVILALVIGAGGYFFIIKGRPSLTRGKTAPPSESTVESRTEAENGQRERDAKKAELLLSAQKLSLQYNYDEALSLLQDSGFTEDPQVQAALQELEEVRSTLVAQDITTVTHVFFHSLIVDPSKTFSPHVAYDGYNQVMTTIPEFNKILQNLYDKGFVLVSIHDLAQEEESPEGGMRMVARDDLLLPPGKKPLVMSQDDVCYYEYMTGQGFANRLVIGKDKRVTCEMDLEDGSQVRGDYDLIPILDHFIDEHPDFSYKGAKAIIAVTGYNGIFGYRTAPKYSENPTYEADKAAAAAVAAALKEEGYELASHSWGHRNLSTISYADLVTDSNKWRDEVESLTGKVDILLFPFGADVGDWHPYAPDNDKFKYLYDLGFRYFCNVDSAVHWVQVGPDYFRQARRNLDGYRMWRDITEPDNKKLSDLFDANEVFDPVRPTPVAPMN